MWSVLFRENLNGAVEIDDGDLDGLGVMIVRSARVIRQGFQASENRFEVFPDLAGETVLHR